MWKSVIWSWKDLQETMVLQSRKVALSAFFPWTSYIIVGCGRSWLDFTDSTSGEPRMIQTNHRDVPKMPLFGGWFPVYPSLDHHSSLVLLGNGSRPLFFDVFCPSQSKNFTWNPKTGHVQVGMLLCNHKFLLHLLEFSFHPAFDGGSSLTSKNVDSTEWVKENQINLAIHWKTTGKSMWKITNCGRDWLTQPTSLALFRRYPLVFLSQVRWSRPLISLFSVAQIPISSGSIRLYLPISAAEKIPSVHFCQK